MFYFIFNFRPKISIEFSLHYSSNKIWKFFFSAVPALSFQKCLPRRYGIDRIVCVCNTNYCDTLDPVRQISAGKYLQYTSNKAGKRFEQSLGYFSSINNTESFPTIEVNRDMSYQTIFGFGGAFTDSTGINIMSLNEDVRSKLMM